MLPLVIRKETLVALFLRLFVFTVKAQLECDQPNTLVNASDKIKFTDPFRTPNGIFQNGSGEWTWTLATQTAPIHGNDTEISQVLRLNIDPIPDFLTKNLSYFGCGIVIRGIAHDTVVNGQNDSSGQCNGTFIDQCRKALLSYAERQGRATGAGAFTIDHVCDNLGIMKDWKKIDECSGDFGKNWWIETFPFAHPLLSQSCGDYQPGASNESHAIRTWGHSTYGTADLASYYNLTTLIEPIITVVLSRDTSPTDRFAKAQLMCPRTGRNVSEGSVPAPTIVPSPRGSIGERLIPDFVFCSILLGIVVTFSL